MTDHTAAVVLDECNRVTLTRVIHRFYLWTFLLEKSLYNFKLICLSTNQTILKTMYVFNNRNMCISHVQATLECTINESVLDIALCLHSGVKFRKYLAFL